MEIKFLGQGLRPGTEVERPVGDVLATEATGTYTSLLAFVAFTSAAGAEHLCEALAKNTVLRAGTRLFVGVDLQGTSREALECLLNANIQTNVFYTRSGLSP